MAPSRSTTAAAASDDQGLSDAFLRILDEAPLGEPDSPEVAQLVAEGRAEGGDGIDAADVLAWLEG
jgi:hypothetical protein